MELSSGVRSLTPSNCHDLEAIKAVRTSFRRRDGRRRQDALPPVCPEIGVGARAGLHGIYRAASIYPIGIGDPSRREAIVHQTFRR